MNPSHLVFFTSGLWLGDGFAWAINAAHITGWLWIVAVLCWVIAFIAFRIGLRFAKDEGTPMVTVEHRGGKRRVAVHDLRS